MIVVAKEQERDRRRVPARDTRLLHDQLLLDELNKLWDHSTVPDEMVNLEKIADDLKGLLEVALRVADDYGIDAIVPEPEAASSISLDWPNTQEKLPGF